MWTSAMLASLIGLGLVGWAVVQNHPREDEQGNWALSRGAAVLALGCALFLGDAVSGADVVPLRADTLAAVLLAALLVARFADDRIQRLARGARESAVAERLLRPMEAFVSRRLRERRQ